MLRILSLLSPKEIKFIEPVLFTTLSNQNLEIDKLGLEFPINTEIISITENIGDGTAHINIPVDELLSKKIVDELKILRESVNRCSEIAEALCDKLKGLNTRLSYKKSIKDIVAKYPNNDFMSHRMIFGDIIKGNCCSCVNKVLDTWDKKSIRTSLDHFILDRNKYVHGKILYWTEQKINLISFQSSKNQILYAKLDIDILRSFVECYKALNSIMSEINECINKPVFITRIN